MREILFRGKLKSCGEWAYGNLRVALQGTAIITPDETVLGKYGQVDPETVGQYTGLRDKDGQKIFEGDIVCWPKEDGYGRVHWTNGEARFAIEFEGCIVDFDNLWGYELEIIGNIHDNPELLLEGDE